MSRIAALVAVAAPLAAVLAAAPDTVGSAGSSAGGLRRASVASLLSGDASAADEPRFAQRSTRAGMYVSDYGNNQGVWRRSAAAAALYGQGGVMDPGAGELAAQDGFSAGHATGVAQAAHATAAVAGLHPSVVHAAVASGAAGPVPPGPYAYPGLTAPFGYGGMSPYPAAYGMPVPGVTAPAVSHVVPAYGAYGSALWSDYRLCSNSGIPPAGTAEFPYPDVDGAKAKRKVQRSLMLGQPVGTFAFRKGVQPNTVEADTVAGQHQGGVSMITTYTFRCIGGAGVGRLDSMDGLGTRSTVQEWIASKPSLFRFPLGDQPAVPEGHAALMASGYPGQVHGFAHAAFSFRERRAAAGKDSEDDADEDDEADSEADDEADSEADDEADSEANDEADSEADDEADSEADDEADGKAKAQSSRAARGAALPAVGMGFGMPMMPPMVHPYLAHAGVAAYAHGLLPGHAVTHDPLTGEDFDVTPIAAERGPRMFHHGAYGAYSTASPLMLNGVHTAYMHPAYSTGLLLPAAHHHHPALWAAHAHPAARPYAHLAMGGALSGTYGMYGAGMQGMGLYSPMAMAGLYGGMPGGMYGVMPGGMPGVMPGGMYGGGLRMRASSADAGQAKIAAPRFRSAEAPAAGGTNLVATGPNTAADESGSAAAQTAAQEAIHASGAAAARAAGAANTYASGGFPLMSAAAHAWSYGASPYAGMHAAAGLVMPPGAGGSAIGFPYDAGFGAAALGPYAHVPFPGGVGYHAAAHAAMMPYGMGMLRGGMGMHPYGMGMGMGMHPYGMGMGMGMHPYGMGMGMGMGMHPYGMGMHPYGTGMGMHPYGMGMGPFGGVHPAAGMALAQSFQASQAAHGMAMQAEAHDLVASAHKQAAKAAHAGAGFVKQSAEASSKAADAIGTAAAAAGPLGILLQQRATSLRGATSAASAAPALAASSAAGAAAAEAVAAGPDATWASGVAASSGLAARPGRHLRSEPLPSLRDRVRAALSERGVASAASAMRFASRGRHTFLPAHPATTGATAFLHPDAIYGGVGLGHPAVAAAHSSLFAATSPYAAAHAAMVRNPYAAMLHGYGMMGPGNGMMGHGAGYGVMARAYGLGGPVYPPGMTGAGLGTMPGYGLPLPAPGMMAPPGVAFGYGGVMAGHGIVPGFTYAAGSAPGMGASWLQTAAASHRAGRAASKALAGRVAAKTAALAGRVASLALRAADSARAVRASTKGGVSATWMRQPAASGFPAALSAQYGHLPGGALAAMPGMMMPGAWGGPAAQLVPAPMAYVPPFFPHPYAGATGMLPYAAPHPFAHAYSPFQAGQYHPLHHPMYPYGPSALASPHQSVLSSLAAAQTFAVCRQVNLPPASPTPDFPFYNRHATEAKYIHEQLLPGLPVGTYAVRMAASGDAVAVDVNVPLDKASPSGLGPTRVAHYKFRCQGNQLVDVTDPARSYYSLESLSDSIPVLQNALGSVIPETMQLAASGAPVTPAVMEHLRQSGIVNEQMKKANSGQIGTGIVY